MPDELPGAAAGGGAARFIHGAIARAKSSHLVGITGYSTPWQNEVARSLGQNLESVVLFALDQFCPDELPGAAAGGGAAQSDHVVNARARAPSYLFSSNRVIVLN